MKTSTHLRAYVATFIACILLVPIYWVGTFDHEFIVVASNILFPLAAAVATAICFLAVKKYGWRGGLPSAMTFFLVSLILWFLAELTWTIYVLLLGIEVPWPSIVDFFYIAGYIPFYIGLLIYLKIFRRALSKVKIGALVILTVLLAAIIVLFLVPLIVTPEAEPLEQALCLTYPILDIILFTLGLAGVFVFIGGRIGVSWLILSLSFLIDAIADILFSYFDLLGLYYEGHPLELPFLWAYFVFTLAFYIHLKEL